MQSFKWLGLVLCVFIAQEKLFSTAIVFVHIGRGLPKYVNVALQQARLFNPSTEIYLIASNRALRKLHPDLEVTVVPIESLRQTCEHLLFKYTCKNTDFWLHTSERFLVLHDFMQQYDVTDVFHLENDNMLYANVSELVPIMQKHYSNIAATFDHEERAIAGIIYIKDRESMMHLSRFFAQEMRPGMNDMHMLGKYRRSTKKEKINHLPIAPYDYVVHEDMRSPQGNIAVDKFDYCKTAKEFGGIFDAAALGQYLGGIDPIHGDIRIGFINESSLFNPSHCTYEWLADDMNRLCPYAVYRDKKYKIYNLHIHSKNLRKFSSEQKDSRTHE